MNDPIKRRTINIPPMMVLMAFACLFIAVMGCCEYTNQKAPIFTIFGCCALLMLAFCASCLLVRWIWRRYHEVETTYDKEAL